MAFVEIFWKNNIWKAYLLKTCIVGTLRQFNCLRDTSPVLLSDWWLHTNPSKFDLVCNVMNWVNFRRICMESSEHNAPIKVNPRGGGGVRAKGGDLTNFKIFWSNLKEHFKSTFLLLLFKVYVSSVKLLAVIKYFFSPLAPLILNNIIAPGRLTVLLFQWNVKCFITSAQHVGTGRISDP